MLLNTNFLTEDEFYDNLRMEVMDDQKFNKTALISESTLGIVGLALLAGFGGALIARTRDNKKGKVRGFFRRLFGKKNKFDFDSNKQRAIVKREQEKAKAAQDRIPEVFRAIKEGDWDEAEFLFKKSDYTDNPDVIKAVAMAICDKLGEPPLYVYPTGNEAYFKCKQIIGMRYAKAITQSVIAAMRQNKSYVSIADADIDNV